MAKINLDKRIEKYEDFYDRCFSTTDINEIYGKGGGASLNDFKEQSKGKTSDKSYWEAMFNRTVKKNGVTKKSDKLGQEVYKRFFENETITKNKVGRIIIRTGYKATFKGKTYKGGMFVPRAFLARRY